MASEFGQQRTTGPTSILNGAHPRRQRPQPALMLGAGLILWMIGCGKKTPTYAGPPDTVRQIVMKKWEIEPNRVEVPQGARVELVVTSTDVEHGIACSRPRHSRARAAGTSRGDPLPRADARRLSHALQRALRPRPQPHDWRDRCHAPLNSLTAYRVDHGTRKCNFSVGASVFLSGTPAISSYSGRQRHRCWLSAIPLGSSDFLK